MKKILITIQLWIALMSSFQAKAFTENNAVDTSGAHLYLQELKAVLDNSPLYFARLYFREIADSTGITRDSITDQYFKSGDNVLRIYHPFFTTMDSVKVHQVQNELENVRVELEAKLIVFERRIRPVEAMLGLDLLDDQFVQDHVQQMYALDSLGYKRIKVAFKPGSPYLYYTCTYDTLSVSLKHIEFAIKTSNGTGGTGYEKIEHKFLLSWEWFLNTPVDFSTDKFYTRRNGVYVLKPQYADFEILDLSAF